MRRSSSRVIPASFLRYLHSMESRVEQRATHSTAYWLVPKHNLLSIKADISKALVTPEQLADMGVPCGAIGHNRFYVVDQVISRQDLPLGTSVYPSIPGT